MINLVQKDREYTLSIKERRVLKIFEMHKGELHLIYGWAEIINQKLPKLYHLSSKSLAKIIKSLDAKGYTIEKKTIKLGYGIQCKNIFYKYPGVSNGK